MADEPTQAGAAKDDKNTTIKGDGDEGSRGLGAFLGRMRRLAARARPAIKTRSAAIHQQARALPGRVVRDVRARGTSPRAWLGEPRMWIDRRRRRFWVVAALVTYSLLGFLIVPWIARSEIASALGKTFDRPVTLEGLRINPFALSVDLRGFALTEKDGTPLTGFDRFYARFALSSVLRWAWCFDEIRLEGAKTNIVRFAADDTNIGRLLNALKSPEAAPEKESGHARLVIRRLEIKDTTTTFTDHVPAKPFTTTVGPVYVKLTRLSTLRDKTGKQHVFVETEGGAVLEWTGTFGLNPLASEGHVHAKGPYAPVITRYLEDTLKFAATRGETLTDLDYRLETRADGVLALAVNDLNFALSDVALQQTGTQSPFATLPALQLTGGHLALPEKIAGAETLTLDGLSVSARRSADGTIDLAQLGASDKKSAAPTPAKADAPAQSGSDGEWAFSLGKVEIKNAKARFDDQGLRTPGATEISNFNLAVDKLSNTKGAAFPFTLASDVAPGGHVNLAGRFSALPQVTVDAKLAVNALKIAAAQPYLHEGARMTVADGALDVETDIKMTGPGQLSVTGQGAVKALKLIDEADNSPVVSWDRVGIDQFTYSQDKNALQISQVTIGTPFLRFFVAKDRSTNFSHIIVAKTDEAAPPPAEPSAPADGAKSQAMNISVGKITVAEGSADYADDSLPLPFAAHITDLKGDVATLATASSAPSSLNLHGQVGEFGEVKIDGALTPFDPTTATDIDILFRNVEFPGLSPYTVKFAGQRIAGGKLDVSLKYAIDHGKLQGANRVVIRNIELGEKVDVPGAANLPLGLAIAVLKDPSGNIDVDLPVSGDVNDPKFAFGSVIWKAIFNLLTNIVTSPFQALAGLAGGDGSKLDHIDFEPGSATLAPPEKEKIVQLAKALVQRPALALTVPGVVDPDADRVKLQLDAVDAAMAEKLGKKNTLERQRRYLVSQFKDRIGKDALDPLEAQFTHPPADDPTARPQLDEAAFVAALRTQVAATEPVSDADLEKLASARANAVVEALKHVEGLDPTRVRAEGSTKAKASEDDAIALKLKATTVSSKN